MDENYWWDLKKMIEFEEKIGLGKTSSIEETKKKKHPKSTSMQ